MSNDDVSLYHIEQLRAIDGLLSHKPDFHYRKICRWFSKNFNHPLLDVLKMPMPTVLQHYYESQVEEADYNHIYDLAQSDYLPEFIEDREIEDEAFAVSLIAEQQETLKKKAIRDKKEKDAERPKSDPTAMKTNRAKQSQSLTEKPPEGSVDEISMDFGDVDNPDGEDR